ncbi:MAG: TolC family protein [Deltaproteobacteria bacterium]|nr:TolC family protein [Deltaproteobacteria bacterium]
MLAATTMGVAWPTLGAENPAALTIEEAIGLAMQRDERIARSQSDANAAQGLQDRARAFFFPELIVTGAYIRRPRETFRMLEGRQVVAQRFNALQGNAQLNVPLFWASAIPLYRQARLQHEAAELSAAEQRRLIGFETADAFVNVLTALEIETAAQRRLDFAKERLTDAQARAEAGLVSSNDVTRGQLEVANAEREVWLAKGQSALARTELGHLLVTDVKGELVPPHELISAATNQPLPADQEQVEQGQRARLDVLAGDKLVLASQESAKEPRLRFIPRLTGNVLGRYTNEPGFTGLMFDWQAGATLSWALFDGGVRWAESHQRDAVAQSQALTQAALRRTVTLDVRRARLALESARATQAAALKAREVAAKHAKETAELYREGLVRSLEVADANLNLFEAEVTCSRDRYALMLAYLDLKTAVGERPPGVK